MVNALSLVGERVDGFMTVGSVSGGDDGGGEGELGESAAVGFDDDHMVITARRVRSFLYFFITCL